MNVSPVRLEADVEEPLSRWLWLVKWLLLIPHWICLVFLWLCLAVTTMVVLVVMLFTGRYPRGLFDFNVGVLRWTWRVSVYSYGALSTDRYPPFTMKEVDDYPARLWIAYPETQRRGLPLVGAWVLGIPQFVLAGLFVGSGFGWSHFEGGAVGVLIIAIALVLLFKTHYRRDVFDLLMGFHRYGYRALAYFLLMTPEYPPFRFDPGAREPV